MEHLALIGIVLVAIIASVPVIYALRYVALHEDELLDEFPEEKLNELDELLGAGLEDIRISGFRRRLVRGNRTFTFGQNTVSPGFWIMFQRHLSKRISAHTTTSAQKGSVRAIHWGIKVLGGVSARSLLVFLIFLTWFGFPGVYPSGTKILGDLLFVALLLQYYLMRRWNGQKEGVVVGAGLARRFIAWKNITSLQFMINKYTFMLEMRATTQDSTFRFCDYRFSRLLPLFDLIILHRPELKITYGVKGA
ncbi:MAG: hypothetical protein SWQ30_14685 [Thermodesulfobacteriota bacterium]|nr:hypothetical protein [Thermodesulfobacteriota bacterium]